ncbi:hypothetical protein [Candidatus Thiodictyon syntrophicum]|jgi:hypothetical protein|uniref:Uncharacterized protein n=1 Tax=Candidatus Thiodictyon syntrophicum TaxID=1166950 RepID=A0A2K8U6V8_9GAMM|nr:hypothetical protein [Candidatus Thiodictyon syntrophicum]AUB80781.1 hypothetical protein THSYN_07310 [Candidatus Thiodictyon syntrophicum]
MFFPIPEPVRRQAKTPHELTMVNLLIFNLLTLIALLGGSFVEPDSSLAPYRVPGVMVPLGLSLAIVAYSFLRARRATRAGPWFPAAHWRLASGRYRILLAVYLGGAGLIGLGWLLAHTQKLPGMQAMMFIALQRVAIAPMLIALMVLVMLASGAIYQAQRGEVPDRLIQRFPPPPDLTGADTEFASGAAAA